MKRLKLKSLFVAVMTTLAAPAYAAQSVSIQNTPLPVAVTNNPVKTTDAFARTPVKVQAYINTHVTSYTVPTGYRLVIETVNAFLICPSGVVLTARLNFTDPSTSIEYSIDPQHVVGSDSFAALNSVRVVIDPGTSIKPSVAYNALENDAAGVMP